MATRKRTVGLVVLLCACFSLCGLGALLKCPDCANMVSPRAEFCPKCGCPMTVIREGQLPEEPAQPAEQPAEPAEPAAGPPIQAEFLRIKTDLRGGAAVAIRQDFNNYAVGFVRPLEGAMTFFLQPLARDTYLRSTRLELAEDRDLVRFAVTATNISCLALSESPAQVGAKVRVVYPGAKPGECLSTDGEVAAVEEAWLTVRCAEAPRGRVQVVTDTAGGVLALADSGPSGEAAGQELRAIAVSPQVRWIAVDITDFREQASLLAEAQSLAASTASREGSRYAAFVERSLERTEWVTPRLKQRAEALKKRLSVD